MSSSDPRATAMKYLEDHKVIPLFELLGAKMVVMKPNDPNAFLIAELQKIKDLKSKNLPVTLFSESDLDILFSIFDITGRGYVTRDQLSKAFDAIGAKATPLTLPMTNTIDKGTFVRILLAEANKRAL